MRDEKWEILRYAITLSTLIVCFLYFSSIASAADITVTETIPANESFIEQMDNLETDDELQVDVDVTGGPVDMYLRLNDVDVNTETIDGTDSFTYVIEEDGNYELVFENNNIDEVQVDATVQITKANISLATGMGTENETAIATIMEEETLPEETLPEFTEVMEEEATPFEEPITEEVATPRTPGFEVLVSILALLGLIYVLRKR